MPSSKPMPRAKRERLCRIYKRFLDRIDHDLTHNNGRRLGICADLMAAQHHVGQIVRTLCTGI